VIHSSVISNLAPIRASVVIAVTSRSCGQPCTRTSPRVISPATRYENASSRSPASHRDAPRSLGTPSMMIRRSGLSSMCAPIRCRNSASSTTSGSVAALRSTVLPSASTAESSTVSVAPTLG
jgi:hypothetical protein